MEANFTATPLSGVVPLTVQFTDLSSGVPYLWAWDFDNDGIMDSNQQHPCYTYTIPGKYSVLLVLNNGEQHILKVNYIEVLPLSNTDDATILPVITNISQPHPNPFRGRTAFKATINEDGLLSMVVYNVRGQKVRTLVNDRKTVGIYQFVWDGKNDRGNYVASGIYSIEMKHNRQKVGVVRVSYLR